MHLVVYTQPVSIEPEIKYEGFGRGSSVGGGPVARSSCLPLKSGPASSAIRTFFLCLILAYIRFSKIPFRFLNMEPSTDRN